MEVTSEALRDIILRAQAGEHEAFELLYRMYLAPVYRYVFIRVRNKEDAEDVVQETFLKAYAALPRYRDERASMLPYLFTIARNLIINHSKKKRADVYVPEDIDRHAATEDTAQRSIDSDKLNEVRTLMECLTETEREVVELRFFGERTYEEIAQVTDKREDAVRQHVARALKKMKEFAIQSPEKYQ